VFVVAAYLAFRRQWEAFAFWALAMAWSCC
jgi:hypothetical protein